VTNHDPLLVLLQQKQVATKRQEKMLLSIDFTLRYRPGKLMNFRDAFSRVPATVPDIVKTFTQDEAGLFFEEGHVDLGKHNGSVHRDSEQDERCLLEYEALWYQKLDIDGRVFLYKRW